MNAVQRRSSPKRISFFVLQTGILTTALVLIGVWFLTAYADFYLMGLYVMFIVPVGALIVGIAAGSGYGLASLFTGVKISKLLLVAVLVLQVGAYFGSQYVEYLSYDLVYEDTGEPVSFADWFHITTIFMEWDRSGSGEPLGLWGYGLRLLELAGFAGGGLVIPAVLMASPYCERCQRYRSTKVLGLIPAAVPEKKLKGADPETVRAHQREQEQAMEDATARFERMFSSAVEGDGAAFAREFEPFIDQQRSIDKLTCRIQITLNWCKGCHEGTLEATVVAGHGDGTQRTYLTEVAVQGRFVRDMLHGIESGAGPADAVHSSEPDKPSAE